MKDCIAYQGTLNEKGYGRFSFKGKKVYAHRLAYCLHNGIDIDSIKGLVIRHKCDNPICVNPLHLEIGTNTDNCNDKLLRGRQAKGEGHGQAKLTEQMVRDIRKRYVPYCKNNGGSALASEYGVKPMVISDIILGKTWRHVK